ncbi:putative glycosidase [Helianthus annuus]|nr:putative glycosidase [Helianthus annuus]
MVHRVYKGIEPKPLIIAPGGFFNPKWFMKFLNKTSKTLNAVSHHIYSLGSGNFSLKQLKLHGCSIISFYCLAK